MTTRRLYDYWNRLRGSRTAPERREIEPSDIRTILNDTFILEARDRENYPFRLAGTRMCATYCRELKDQNFLKLWNDTDREAIATLLAAISEDAAAAVIGFAGRTELGKTLSFELLLLPVRFGDQGYTRILGSCCPVDQPYWLGIQPIRNQEMVSVRLIWPDEKPSFLHRSLEFNEERNVVPFPDSGRDGRRYRHLVVYPGGRG